MAETPFQTLERLRNTPPYNVTPLTRQLNGALLNEVCYTHRAAGWGMQGKDDDNSAIHPNGETISRDVLVNKVTLIWVDCLADAENKAIPIWDEHADADTSAWVPPVKPSVVVPPIEPPQPPTEAPVTSYGQWVSVEMPMLAAAYRQEHGVSPAPSDYAHLGWRRLVERWTIQAMLKDI
jgi:hypothetical protein